jgi:group I intron endonuclease
MKVSEAGIYAIRHSDSGRLYVGSAVNIAARWRQHKSQLRRGLHHSRYLQAAWGKYGESGFVFEVLEVVPDKADLIGREDAWIAKLDAANPVCGFNVCKKARSMLGMRHSEEAKSRMAASARREKSPEHQAAINAALRGRTLSEECKRLISESRRGTTASDQTRQKMSATRTGRRLSAETKAKIAAHAAARHAAARAAGVTIGGKPLMGYALKQKLSEA